MTDVLNALLLPAPLPLWVTIGLAFFGFSLGLIGGFLLSWSAMTPDEAKQTVSGFLDSSKSSLLERYERALRKIARRWPSRAAMIADGALGTGPFWCSGFAEVPRTYLSYVWARLKVYLKYGPR